jgi:shikimate dehydrogenase
VNVFIDARSKLCAVIGWPVEHSLSPAIHNAAFEAVGLNFAYLAFAVKPGDLAGALAGVRSLGMRGLSVTIPHKVDIIALLDEVEELAAKTGSVNTVVNDGGRLRGYSTDGPGALAALEAAGVDPCGRDVLLLGSGGAARAIGFALVWQRPPARIRIYGIIPEEVARLKGDLLQASSIEIEGGPMELLAGSLEAADIIIHATPMGMSPHTSHALIEREMMRPGQCVFDVVYNPLETELLRRARQAGATVVPGVGMFVHQAALQFRLWTGAEPPVQVMERVVRKSLVGEAG